MDMNQPGLELLVRVGLAAVLGVAIGLERQWRSRMAGLQTMALVSMGSALFTIMGAYSFPDQSDRNRVAAQIVTGIGFLGAGVIIKAGLTVFGLNTAATLWATAAVGALCGVWMWREAIACGDNHRQQRVPVSPREVDRRKTSKARSRGTH